MHPNARLRAGLAVALAASTLLGCQARRSPVRAAARRPPPSLANTASGPGDQALAVAFAQNAIQAIALGGEVAALNNLDQAISRAQSSQGQRWIAPSGGRGRYRSTSPPLDANGVSALLISAKAKLLEGDLAAASAELAPVAKAAPPGLRRTQLPLLRASASLGLAQGSFRAGRIDESRIELRAAAMELRAAAADAEGPAALAGALAREIAGAAASPGSVARLQAGRLTAWIAQVDGWLGGPSHGADLVVAMNDAGEA